MSSSARPRRTARGRAALALPTLLASSLLLLPSGPADGATGPTQTTQSTTASTPTPSPSPAPNPNPPKVTTGTAEAIAGTTATLTATLSAGGGETTYRFQYGTSNSYGLTTAEAKAPADASSSTVKIPITGLTLGTTYHFRITATNAAGSVQGSDRTFTTTSAPKAPAVSTQAATKAVTNGAQLNARVSPQGQETSLRFDWGATTAYGNTTASVSAGASRGTVSRGISVTSLTPGTVYHYRAVASNGSGTVVGKDRTFTTSRGLTTVTAVLAAPTVAWDQALAITGSVSGAAPGGVKLELLRQDRPFNSAFRRVGTTTTNASGAYTLAVSRVFSSVRVRVRVIGSSTLQSPELNVGSEVLVKLTAGVRKARTTRLRGVIFPATTAASAVLQRQTPSGRWARVRALRLSPRPSNRVSYRTVVRRIGRDALYRVVVDPRDDGAHVLTTSATVRVAARR